MITDALAFIHARKWLVELILAAVIVAGVWWFCHHLIDVGVQRQKDADARELVKLQHDADIKTAKAQERADLAEKARDIEITQLDDYRRQHPLHGRLCVNEGGSHLPAAAASNGVNGGAASSPGSVLTLSAGDPGAVGSGDPDIRGMLDALAGRADLLSAQVREWQSR